MADAMITHRPSRRPLALDEGGFTLMEVLVSLLIVALVSLATGVFFVSSVSRTAEAVRQENALAVATAALERVQSVPVGSLLTGRSATAVASLVNDPVVSPLVAQDVVASGNSDAAASGTSTPVIPLSTADQVLKGTTYTVRTAINRCWLSPTTQQCTRTQPSDGVSVYRATVIVTWGTCGSRCRYSTSALLDAQGDPVFTTPQPIISTITPVPTAVVGDILSLTLTGKALAAGPTVTTGAGGGTFSAITRVGTDGRSSTASWAVGSVPGSYTLAWRNPDGGYAEYSPLAVLPRAVKDCSPNFSNGTSTVAVLGNDTPNSGTVTITQGPTSGTATVDSSNRIQFTPANGASGMFTVSYTVTVNGQTSAAVAVTFRYKTSTACP